MRVAIKNDQSGLYLQTQDKDLIDLALSGTEYTLWAFTIQNPKIFENKEVAETVCDKLNDEFIYDGYTFSVEVLNG